MKYTVGALINLRSELIKEDLWIGAGGERVATGGPIFVY